jgi:hypothetical protein
MALALIPAARRTNACDVDTSKSQASRYGARLKMKKRAAILAKFEQAPHGAG